MPLHTLCTNGSQYWKQIVQIWRMSCILYKNVDILDLEEFQICSWVIIRFANKEWARANMGLSHCDMKGSWLWNNYLQTKNQLIYKLKSSSCLWSGITCVLIQFRVSYCRDVGYIVQTRCQGIVFSPRWGLLYWWDDIFVIILIMWFYWWWCQERVVSSSNSTYFNDDAMLIF